MALVGAIVSGIAAVIAFCFSMEDENIKVGVLSLALVFVTAFLGWLSWYGNLWMNALD
jgi:hypothetical protein